MKFHDIPIINRIPGIIAGTALGTFLGPPTAAVVACCGAVAAFCCGDSGGNSAECSVPNCDNVNTCDNVSICSGSDVGTVASSNNSITNNSTANNRAGKGCYGTTKAAFGGSLIGSAAWGAITADHLYQAGEKALPIAKETLTACGKGGVIGGVGSAAIIGAYGMINYCRKDMHKNNDADLESAGRPNTLAPSLARTNNSKYASQGR